MTITWFRLHHEIIDDPKIGLMSESEQLLWIKMLCLANMDRDRGCITISDEEACFRLRVNLEFWKCSKEKFRCKGLIDFNSDGSIKICKWEERQYSKPSDNPEAVRQRVARHRAKKKESCNAIHGVTEYRCNDPVTTSCNADPDPDPDPDPNTYFQRELAQKTEDIDSEQKNALNLTSSLSSQEQSKIDTESLSNKSAQRVETEKHPTHTISENSCTVFTKFC